MRCDFGYETEVKYHSCPNCGEPLPLYPWSVFASGGHSATFKVGCPHCGILQELSKQLLTWSFCHNTEPGGLVKLPDAEVIKGRSFKAVYGVKQTPGRLRIEGRVGLLRCLHCAEPLTPATEVGSEEAGRLRCSRCNGDTRYAPLPAWLRRRGSAMTHTLWAAPEGAAEPLTVRCELCAAEQPLGPLASRAFQCHRCGEVSALPEETWGAMEQQGANPGQLQGWLRLSPGLFRRAAFRNAVLALLALLLAAFLPVSLHGPGGVLDLSVGTQVVTGLVLLLCVFVAWRALRSRKLADALGRAQAEQTSSDQGPRSPYR